MALMESYTSMRKARVKAYGNGYIRLENSICKSMQRVQVANSIACLVLVGESDGELDIYEPFKLYKSVYMCRRGAYMTWQIQIIMPFE